MKLYITSNTNFGYKDMINNQLSYFYEQIIPFIKDKYKDGDIFVHMGNIFNNKKIVTLDILNRIISLFEKISEILPIYIIRSRNDELSNSILMRLNNVNIIDNKYKLENIIFLPLINNLENEIKDIDGDILLFNYDYLKNPETYKSILKNKFEVSICGLYDDIDIIDDNIINIGSPYYLNKSNKYKKGFLVLDNNKKKFKLVPNKYSPIFVSITIKSIEDIVHIENNKNNFIDLKICKDLLLNKEYDNKIKIMLNNYTFNNITYIDNDNIDNKPTKELTNTIDIRELIKNYLLNNELDLYDQLNTVYKIYDNKKVI